MPHEQTDHVLSQVKTTESADRSTGPWCTASTFVPSGSKHVRAVVTGVIVAVAGWAVVAPARGDCSCVEALDGLAILRLEGDVQARCGLAVTTHEELVGREPAVSLRHDPESQRLEGSGVEPLARLDVSHTQVDVVEEPARMRFRHAGRLPPCAHRKTARCEQGRDRAPRLSNMP